MNNWSHRRNVVIITLSETDVIRAGVGCSLQLGCCCYARLGGGIQPAQPYAEDSTAPTTRDPAELSRCLDIDCQSGCSECEPLQVGPNFPNNNLLVAAAWKRFGALRFGEVCKKLSSAGWLWHCSRAARAGRAALYCENWCAKPTLRGARVVLQDWCLL